MGSSRRSDAEETTEGRPDPTAPRPRAPAGGSAGDPAVMVKDSAMNASAGGGRCIFCSTVAKRTKEHVWPSWVESILPGQGAFVLTTTSDAPGFRPRSWEKRGFDVTVRQVCSPCNNGRLSGLENAIKQLLTELVLGRAVVLSPLDQERLATWTYKTAMMFALTNRSGGRYFEDHEYVAFKADPRPAEGTRAWLAAYEGQWTTWYRKRVVEIARRQTAESREGHVMVATLGYLVLVQFTSRWETMPWAMPPHPCGRNARPRCGSRRSAGRSRRRGRPTPAPAFRGAENRDDDDTSARASRLCSVFATSPSIGWHFGAQPGTPQTTTGGPGRGPEPPVSMKKRRPGSGVRNGGG